MSLLLQEIRDSPMLWLLIAVPVVFVAAIFIPEAHTTLFVLSVLAIVPLAGLAFRMAELAAWLEGQAADDRFEEAAAELSERGLTR